MSGESWLEVRDQSRGLIDLAGDAASLPESGGGLLAVRRPGDGHWLTGVDQWQPGGPQWFPFGREVSGAGAIALEVNARPLLELLAAPPAAALSARLRFPARAGQEARLLDLDLRFQAGQGVVRPATPEPTVDDARASTPSAPEPARLPATSSDEPPHEEAPAVAPLSDLPTAEPAPTDTDTEEHLALAGVADGRTERTPTEARGTAVGAEARGDEASASRGGEPFVADSETDHPQDRSVLTTTEMPTQVEDRTPSWGGIFDEPDPSTADGDSPAVLHGKPSVPGLAAPKQIAIAAIPLALLVALVIWWLWPDGREPDNGTSPQTIVRDRAYIADLLEGDPPAAELFSEAEEADAEGDCDAAVLLYREAAKGDAALASRLGAKYDPEGFVASRCITLASSSSAQVWYETAAEAGDPAAQRRLGELMLEDGAQGVIRQQAIQWLRRAADGGDAIAAERLKEIGEG
jgi:hypothetical protein